ncbi:hypothetical protein [Tenacibaculum halocynthiae]|uniref:hypothetical protein n=1 Tax=Tenacibaculum halocynthiae TaxID=1254437 RepID=UPI003893BC50
MSSKCKCLNPEKGGTKCPTQHIALCIRGKDRECYGECIPIPSEYNHISDRFTFWAQNEVSERVNEHILSNKKLYKDFPNFKERFNEFKKEGHRDIHPKGFAKFSNEINDEIRVQYSFSFEDRINPLEGGQKLQMQ